MLKLSDDDFYRVVNFIKTNYGINLEKKRILIESRLTGIAAARGYDNFTDYLDHALNDSGREKIRLINSLTTNHTSFMREPDHFRFLETDILPYIENTVTDHDMRIWCAASSTGQEAYTLAMTIDHYFGSRKELWDTHILATDLDTEVLRTAKAGIYLFPFRKARPGLNTADMLEGLPPEWVRSYFVRMEKGVYQVADRIRNQVIFKKFNLMDDIKYKKPFDLISCRNVMIYFDAPTRDALAERFYNVTKQGGYLFIGHAESLSRDTKYKYIKPAVYRKM